MLHPLATPLALSDALPVFERWLAEPAAFDGQRNHRAALCLASQLQRGGYAIRRTTDSAPWRLVQDGVTLAVERRGEPALSAKARDMPEETARRRKVWRERQDAMRAAAAERGLMSREV